jgi:hypothetical protein
MNTVHWWLKVTAAIEESMRGKMWNPRYAFVLLLWARLITYVYPLLLSYFTTLHYMNNGYE